MHPILVILLLTHTDRYRPRCNERMDNAFCLPTERTDDNPWLTGLRGSSTILHHE
jgi:hypothetical protein